jgi:iron-sulfur cluster repair protein YtfE (RIC family)
MNAVDLLKADHERVARLFRAVRATEKDEHPALFKQIKAELTVHAHVEEKLFYPVLIKKGDRALKDITLEGIEEHHQMKLFLGELAKLAGSNVRFEPKLTVLIEDTEHHVKEEENDMFKQVRDQFTAVALDKLGAEMEREKARFVKTLTAADRTALTKSLNAPEQKGPFRSALEMAKDVVSGLLPDGDDKANGNGAKKPSRKPAAGAKGTARAKAKPISAGKPRRAQAAK